MSKYRIRESRGVYYPEKRFLGIFWEPLWTRYNCYGPQGHFNIERAQRAIDCHYQEEHQQKNKFHHYDPTENQ